MADSVNYSMNRTLEFGSVPRAPSREAVKLRMAAEAIQHRAQRDLLLRARDPWPGKKEEPDEVEEYDYWDEAHQ